MVGPGPDDYRGALEAVDRILNREPEADEVLRQVVATLHQRVDGYEWVGISFAEEGSNVLGPWRGERTDGASIHDQPVVYDGAQIATLSVAFGRGCAITEEDRAFLARVALLISLHCLVGWDTGGVPWSEVG
jgi:putative methionine-R-sulfoxide reductase with GAF domain